MPRRIPTDPAERAAFELRLVEQSRELASLLQQGPDAFRAAIQAQDAADLELRAQREATLKALRHAGVNRPRCGVPTGAGHPCRSRVAAQETADGFVFAARCTAHGGFAAPPVEAPGDAR